MTKNTELDTVLEYREPSAIELIGFAKNDIVDSKNLTADMPQEYKEKLSLAYSLLNEVQEYLYNH